MTWEWLLAAWLLLSLTVAPVVGGVLAIADRRATSAATATGRSAPEPASPAPTPRPVGRLPWRARPAVPQHGATTPVAAGEPRTA